jgi:hypothetical protein
MTDRSWEEIGDQLAAPIDWECLPKNLFQNNGSWKAWPAPYVKKPVIENRLDEILGASGWRTSYRVLGEGKTCSVCCRLELTIDGGSTWIPKEEIGTGEDLRLAGSNAFKRASRAWGLGRFLATLPRVPVECETRKTAEGKQVFKKWSLDPRLVLTGEVRPERKGSNGAAGKADRPGESTEDLVKKRADWLRWWEGKGIDARDLCRFAKAETSSWNGSVFSSFRAAADLLNQEGTVPAAALGKVFGAAP